MIDTETIAKEIINLTLKNYKLSEIRMHPLDYEELIIDIENRKLLPKYAVFDNFLGLKINLDISIRRGMVQLL